VDRLVAIGLKALTGAGALLVVLSRPAAAQEMPGLDPKKPISQYVHDTWTIDQGLPQNSVFAIAQGGDGYLWLGTEAGLVRFDGVSFTTFTSANTAGLLDNYVNAIAVDRSSNVWVGTWVGGVSRFSPGRSEAIPGASSSFVNTLYLDRAGTMWAGLNSGLARVLGGRFLPVAGTDTTVTGLTEDSNGTLLAGTDEGIFALRAEGLVPWQPPGGRIEGPVWTVYRDRKGTLWFGTPEALYHARGARLEKFAAAEGLPPGGVTAILETRNGQLWVGTNEGGIARMVAGRFQQFTAQDGLSDNDVTALLEDREGSLWVGTRSGGLNRFREPILTIYTTREGLSANEVWSVYGDRRGDLWVGTSEGGLDRLHEGRVTNYTVKDGLPGTSIFAVLQTRDGVTWAATGNGVARLRSGRWETMSAAGFPVTRVAALTEDRTGALWLGGNAGLFRWKDGALHDFTREAGLSSQRVRTIVEDRDGTLWIGTHGVGLVRLENGRFTTFTTKQGLSNNVIESLFADAHGLWVGTQSGLNLIQNGRITVLPLSADVLMTDLFQILKDDRGNLWLTSNQGVASVSQQELLDAAGGKPGRVPVHQVVALDGRRRIEFNGASQNAGWKTPDGRLWFPSIKGLVVVDPAHLTNNPVPPPVHIERLLVDGKDVDLGGTVEVPPGLGQLEVQYTATSLLIPERVQFRYRLEGYDEDWVEAGTRRVAYYTQVPGGTYRFRVIAANNDGVWNQDGAVLSFRLEPHFFETWWFLVLCGLAATAALVLVFRIRVRRIKEHSKDLARLVDERTVELQQEVAERRLAEERYRDLFDANPQPVWVSDRDTLEFLAVNDAASRHYGYSREEFFAMRLTDLQPSEQGAALPEWIRAAGDGWRGTSAWHHCKKDGTPIEIEVAAHAITFAGRPAALIVAADVTDRRDLEDRLRQAQKMEAVGQLAGGIAHDLNNVLTAVMAHVDLAVTALPSGSTILVDLTQAQRAAHRGATMIRKLLGFSRRERLVLKPLHLEQLVAEIAPTLKHMLPEGVEIVHSEEKQLPPVAADAGVVQQMLFNLVTNAGDAMPGGGRLVINLERATPAEKQMASHDWGTPGHYVVLSVSDNGSGMSEQTVARIFEPYFTTKPAEHGSGLGMAMVYGLMKQHLGYVLVSSTLGKGTEVRLYFPVSAQVVKPAMPEVRHQPQSGNHAILVVDDQEAVRSAASRSLVRFGYRVLSAADGEEGLKMWRADPDGIDLVISDAIMPRMGGLELYEAMSREHPGVRFLLTSGYTGEEVSQTTPTTVDIPFLAKPWTLQELLTAVRDALEPSLAAPK
jgi:PAS domain S-box-containing protein